jgi:hypothetical protein
LQRPASCGRLRNRATQKRSYTIPPADRPGSLGFFVPGRMVFRCGMESRDDTRKLEWPENTGSRYRKRSGAVLLSGVAGGSGIWPEPDGTMGGDRGDAG